MITNKVKFFETNRISYASGARASDGSADVDADNILADNKESNWTSRTADDLDVDTLTVTFNATRTFNRIIIANHNLRNIAITFTLELSLIHI